MIGRINEINVLEEVLASPESEFVAVYGRRRIGKTYLIRNVFKGRFAFVHTGLANASMVGQLENFRASLSDGRLPQCPELKSWREAFRALARTFGPDTGEKQVIFIDELPWMDTPKSGFVSALEHFWNAWASARKDIVLVICGSASSWIVRKVFHDRGGLHNRVTHRIRLEPFSLAECEAYAKERKLALSRRQILEYYAIVGGVPFYWRLLVRGESIAQAVDRLCFSLTGELATEFNHLYSSLFRHPEDHIAVVKALAAHQEGLSRKEIAKASGVEIGGNLTRILEDLEESGFVRRFDYPGRRKRDAVYRLLDAFTIFHLKFIAGNRNVGAGFWGAASASGAANAWRGYAFERTCLLHIAQIREALGIRGVVSKVYAWRKAPNAAKGLPGAQIDLVIERKDGITNLCEMKCTSSPFAITKKYLDELISRREAYRESVKTADALHLTLVAAGGVARNEYYGEIQSEVSLDDLFR